MTEQIVKQIAGLSEDWHQCGTIGADTIAAMARHLSKISPLHSVETGTGKTTLLFSQFSQQHTVFTLDDALSGGSYAAVKSSPWLRQNVVNFVLGPTQITLKDYVFNQKCQVIFIDGPHGYPFPDLEYYHLYEHLETGGLLILDDIHIPTIFNLFHVINEDAMFELLEVVETTAFFKRTNAPTFSRIGDSWHEQGYNKNRHPITLEKELLDVTILRHFYSQSFSWSAFLLARIFGKKTIAYDSGCTVTIHHWRGKAYLTSCVYNGEGANGQKMLD